MQKIILIILFSVVFFTVEAQQKILFDNTKSEEAGNADWIIDNTEPVPSPAQSGITSSSSETYWTGGISAWGVEMVKRGFYVETLPNSGDITYGNSSNSQDLSNYDIFVVCEPNNPFSWSEKTAIINFVYNGGGLFMIADHEGSDRDGDDWDSYYAWRDLLQNNSFGGNPFGMIFDVADYINDYPNHNMANLPDDPLLHGDAGDVNGMEFHGSTAMSINTSENSTVKGVVFRSGSSTSGTTNIMVAYCEYGQGRVVGLGDSSPADDGTGQSGNDLYDGWNELDNGILITNATLWLAEDNVSIDETNSFNIIYPNPSSNGIFNISSEIAQRGELFIYDIKGEIIISETIDSQHNTIDISSFGSGLYFVKIKTENSIIWRKIIVQ